MSNTQQEARMTDKLIRLGYLSLKLLQLSDKYCSYGWRFSIRFEPGGDLHVAVTHPHIPVVPVPAFSDPSKLANWIASHVKDKTAELPEGWRDNRESNNE